jgi:MoaD family protein
LQKTSGSNSKTSFPNKTTQRRVHVKIEVIGHLNQITRKREFEIVLNEPTIQGLIEGLCKAYGTDFDRAVRDPDSGEFLVLILVNGQDIDFLQKSETQLSDGDEVVMVPLVAGG